MPQEDSYSVIIDAVFGVGLSRKVEGRYRQVIEQMNRMRGTKFAVDIPSGLSATTGCILGCAFKADYTVTFQLKKIGLELSQGRTMAGKVIVSDIGISTDSICEDQEIVRTAGKDIYRKMLPDRPEDSNKGTYGRLLVIAGSKGMAGAAYLNAHAAYMTGAGLVRIYTSSDNREILQTLLPEAIITTYEEYNKEELLSLLTWADSVCIGSGLGMSRISKKILKTVIEYVKVPCLIDADGLNLLAENNNYLNQMAERRFVITPHMKEMSRLTGTPVEERFYFKIPDYLCIERFENSDRKRRKRHTYEPYREQCDGKSRIGRCSRRRDLRMDGAGKRSGRCCRIRHIYTWIVR